MPQLNKGGKYVFGLSAISNRREILFPAETLEQYPVQKEGRIIIFTVTQNHGRILRDQQTITWAIKIEAYIR